MKKEKDNGLSGRVRAILISPTWKEIEGYLMFQREAIIHKGKKSRGKENEIKVWAELDGFDKAIGVINRLADYKEGGEISIDRSSEG